MKPFRVNDLTNFKGVGAAVVSPNGEQVVYVVSEILEKENGYRSSLWLKKGEERLPLTNGQKPATRDNNPKWSPDATQIGFISNRSGTNQVWVLSMVGGEARQVSNLFKGVSSFQWAHDSKKIYISGKEETPEDKPREGSTFTHVTRLHYKMKGVATMIAFGIKFGLLN